MTITVQRLTVLLRFFSYEANDSTPAALLGTYNNELKFLYYFSFVRNSSEPFIINKIRMSFAGVDTVELSSSSDGETYQSLGEFDLSSFDAGKQVAEWRRINRESNQVMFKLEVTPLAGTRFAVIDGVAESI